MVNDQFGCERLRRVSQVAVARYVAAHSPTERAQLQTARVARRFSLGEAVYEGEDEEGSPRQ